MQGWRSSGDALKIWEKRRKFGAVTEGLGVVEKDGMGLRSVTEKQVDLLAIKRMAWAFSYGAPGDVFIGEGDQGLAAALTTEVIQDKYGVWLELGASP